MYDYNDNDYNYNLTLDDVISWMMVDSDLDPLLQEDLAFDYSSDYSEE